MLPSSGKIEGMRRLRRSVSGLILVAAGLVTTSSFGQAAEPPAAAETPPDQAAEARRAFQAGQAAFAEGRFAEAADSFEEAFRIKPHASPLVNAGEAWERANEALKAARVYQRVLELPDAGERDRGEATERLARIAPELAAVVLVGDAGVRARVDGDEFQGGNRVYVLPGDHQITLVDAPGSATRSVALAANSEEQVDLAALLPTAKGSEEQPAPPEPDVEPAPRGAKLSAPTFIAYGVGVVGLAAGGFFGLRANSAADDFEDKHARGEPNRDEYDRFGQSKLFANIGFGVGIVGVGVGTFFLIRDLKRPQTESNEQARAPRTQKLELTAAPTPAGAFVGARGRF
jgi:tetratricopeptide (TPR) repeat protein